MLAHGVPFTCALLAAALALLVCPAPAPAAGPADAGVDVPVAGATGDAVVTGVRVEGHQSVGTRELLDAFGVSRGDPLDVTSLGAGADAVLALLARSGSPFATVRVDWDDDDRAEVVVTVHERRDARIESVAIRGNAAIGSDDLLAVIAARAGTPITAGLLEGDAAAIAERYAERGYPLARVRPTVSAGSVREGLRVAYAVTEDARVAFGNVLISGNERTREHVIVRETGIVSGETYNASVVETARPLLERLPFLASVAEPVVAVDRGGGTADVGIEVVEARASRLSGVLGYAPGGDGEGEVTGSVDIDLGNIAGTGRRAAASWERVREGHDRLAFEYTEPWVLGAPIDIGVRAEQVNRDTLYSTAEGDLLVTARFGADLRLTWSIGAERYVPGTGDDPATDGYRTAIAVEYDRTDHPLNPRRGVEIQGSLSYANVDADEDATSQRTGVLSVSGAAYLPVRRAQVLALAARGEALASNREDVPLHRQLVLGGAGDLRGYREEQFHGTTTALATLEYRFILGRNARLAAFLDIGHYARDGANPAEDTKLGYGVGLRGETRLGIIAVDYGLGEGDGFLDGKLHVGLIREF